MNAKRETPTDYLGDVAELADRIVTAVLEASDAEGTAWYSVANAHARSLDPSAPERAAAVIAALSPQSSWSDNLRLARRAYAHGQASGHTFANVAKANAVLYRGEAPLSVLGGPKVRAFYALIADPEHRTAVVVDRHAHTDGPRAQGTRAQGRLRPHRRRLPDCSGPTRHPAVRRPSNRMGCLAQRSPVEAQSQDAPDRDTIRLRGGGRMIADHSPKLADVIDLRTRRTLSTDTIRRLAQAQARLRPAPPARKDER